MLVAAPTGTGKTVVADYVVAKSLHEQSRVIYTAPIKALSNQKFRDYTRLHDPSRIGLVTGDLVINPEAAACIMTTEILRNMLLQDRDRLDDLAFVIFDEIHFLADPERGTVWEEILIYLPKHVRILGLSATMPNVDDFAAWLRYVREEEIVVVKESRRAVPLRIYLYNHQTGLSTRDKFERAAHHSKAKAPSQRGRRSRKSRPTHRQERTRHFQAVQQLSPDYLPCLYFVFFRRLTETFARELSEHMSHSFLSPEDQARAAALIDERSQGWAPEVLKDRQLYLNGVAFHHAGLNVVLKALVEELYEKRLIRVLYCTSTFALGINMPVKTVVFDNIMKFDGTRMNPLNVQQFMQKAGRAGRRGMDEVGYVVVKQEFDEFDQNIRAFNRYRRGEYESVRSTFNLCFNSIANLLDSYEMMEIRDIVNKSFRNFHHRLVLDKIQGDLASAQAEWERLRGEAAPGATPAPASVDDEAEITEEFRQAESATIRRIRERITGRKEWLESKSAFNDFLEAHDNPERLEKTVETLLNQTAPEERRPVRRLQKSIRKDTAHLQKIRRNYETRLHGGHPSNSREGQAARIEKRVASLKHKFRREEKRLYQGLLEKIKFLEDIHYIGDQHRLLAGGRILKSIHIEDIFITELVLADLLSPLEDSELFGVLASLCTDFPRAASLRARIPNHLRDLSRRIMRVRRSHIVTEAERLNGVRTSFSLEVLYLAHLWGEGRSLPEIMLLVDSRSDISGDLVSAFRRAKDLLKQLKDVYRGDNTLTEKLGRIAKTVSRDEVEVLD